MKQDLPIRQMFEYILSQPVKSCHGAVALKKGLLIRPDGYEAWVGDVTERGLADALTTWFGADCI